MNGSLKKGFTLIELLIVIGILAVLATVTVLVLNPAELFRQARDSQRISDLGSIKGAVALYLTAVSNPAVTGPSFTTCATMWSASVAGASSTFLAARNTLITPTAPNFYKTDGNGWVPVNLAAMTGGSPLAVLPRDPVNTVGGTVLTNLYYTYACDTTGGALNYQLDAKMESTRYKNGGANDVEGTDGGADPQHYEIGTAPGLNL